ncbi:MAG TPA: hypothetical protein DCS05_02445 [Nitrospiraceae bacterium]|nr:hypothetical protein [Nitrospiraceae bacterium]
MIIDDIEKCQSCGYWTLFQYKVNEAEGTVIETCTACNNKIGPILWNEQADETIELGQTFIEEILCHRVPELICIRKPGDRVLLPPNYKLLGF